MVHRVEREIGGRTLSIETGRVAGQANGAVMVQYGETVVLVTATMSRNPREGIDFFPLTVDYEERMYAAGKIPGGFIKREGRPSQDATLSARLIDRPLRPLFNKQIRNEVQVVATVMSVDGVNQPDILGIIGASAALSISDIPFEGPVSGARVGIVNGMLVLNPTNEELETSRLDLTVAGTRNAILMVESGSKELPERDTLEAMRFGQEANQAIVELQDELVRAVGKPKIDPKLAPAPEALKPTLDSLLGGRLPDALHNEDKHTRDTAIQALRDEAIASLSEQFDPKMVNTAFDYALEAQLTKDILEDGRRPDGRTPTQIRPITCEVGILPRTHGSGLFTRGQTQVLSVVTLGSLQDEQMLDGIGPETSRRFMHHYNFPPYSTGETGRVGAPRRREIGHGALAERAIEAVIPDKDRFPYTIRVVSEVLSSNGSTSMGSVCGTILALLDAGVPIKAPVAGVAMGLIMGEGGTFQVLTDIQGVEDAFGDMDFKVAGTEKGITALQMDMKLKGLSLDVMEKALAQARDGRLFILGKIKETMAATRPDLSPFAPRMTTININPDKIRYLIGPGGKTIRGLTEQFKVSIDVEDDGTVIVGSPDGEKAQAAINAIVGITRDVVVGDVYTGKVTRITSFGAFAEILPGKEGLIHISELAPDRVERVEDVVKEGDEVQVRVSEIDRMGRINLSRRALLVGADDDNRVGMEDGDSMPPPRMATRDSRGPRRDGPNGGGPRPPRRDGPGGGGRPYSR